MPYREKYKPANYAEIAAIIDATLALEVDHRIHVTISDVRKPRTIFLLREFLYLQKMTEDYVINKTNEGLTISRYGKVEYEISKPEPVGRIDDLGSGKSQESGL